MQEKAVNIIKEELAKRGIKVIKIILFGSRARKDFRPDSDWDFFVMVDKELSFQEMKKIIGEIQWHLAEFKIPNDIIIRSEREFNHVKNSVGYISFFAYKEGVEI